MWYYMMQHTFFVKNLKNNAKRQGFNRNEKSSIIHVFIRKIVHNAQKNTQIIL